MSPARPEEVPSLRPAPPPEPPSLLSRLRRGALPVALLAAVGGAVAFGLAHFRKPWYRATTTLLVGEPVMSGGPTLVDYNLTAVRSFAGLLASPRLCEACAATLGTPAPSADLLARRVKVRVPENTRLVEVSFEAGDPAAAAAFANCLASKAIEESVRISEGLAAQGTRTVDAALERIRTETARLQQELSDARGRSLLELKRARLRATLAALERSAEEERRAGVDAAGSGARRTNLEAAGKARPERRRFTSYVSREPDAGAATSGSGTAGTPVVREESDPTRDLAEKGAAEASASEAAARATAEAATRGRLAAERSAALLEREIAAAEQELDTLGKRVASASSGQAELEKRRSLLPVEAAARSLLLVPLAPALPPAVPSNAAPWLVGLVGAAAAGGLGALLVLSREER